jgi:hypothetical protein
MSIEKKNHCVDETAEDASSSLVLRQVATLCVAVLLCLVLTSSLLNAQENASGVSTGAMNEPAIELSGGNAESGLQPSGEQGEQAVQPSGMEGEIPSAGGGETLQGEAGPSAGQGEAGFQLPNIETPDFSKMYNISPSEAEGVLTLRPRDEYYEQVVHNAPAPDITMLGPIPEIRDKKVEFTDVAADWIYYQKSAGLTELRGHVMLIYDTTIISCDEATLDEKNEIYRFFGEGRVFVDDADFTLECDELEIHDAEGAKTIYVKGSSTMVVFADEKAQEPGDNATRRQRVEYALKQQDTTITFTNAEYDYENEIFDAHGGVKFEQSDKYAKCQEFHGENKTEYMHFTGSCEFWQKSGQWLYDYKIVKDKETPPSRGDKVSRALLSVPTTITSDEAEGKGKDGWLQLRSAAGNVVYFRQDDKHAECDKFTVWYTEEEEKAQPEQPSPEGPRNLLAGTEEAPSESETPPKREIPPGFGSLPLASDFPPDYVPWEASVSRPEEAVQGSAGAATEDAVQGSAGGNEDFSFEFPQGETTQPGGTVGNLAELGANVAEVTGAESGQESTAPHNEILMEGNVFIRQENGNWLFDYDIVREADETKENVEQYRKWANASADTVHVWMDDEIVEASGTVKGEQDNQDGAADFVRYLGKYDMAYLRGNLVVNREGKHKLMSEEGFVFFSTDVFEALGNVQTTVMVDVEEQRNRAQGRETPAEGAPSGGTGTEQPAGGGQETGGGQGTGTEGGGAAPPGTG